MDSEYLQGKMLLVDKPLTWTSFDVVNKLRYTLKKALGIKKIKVGHAGTLDPLATGLLIVMTGKFTKRIDSIQGLPKIYTGIIQLGGSRPSYDMETEIDETFPTEHINDELLQKTILENFIGEIEQLPPMFSAVKVDGVRLYHKARKGQEVERPVRNIQIFSFDAILNAKMEIHFEIKCSKGTYIRSIAHDLGKALDSGAYLKSLRREAIGIYKMKDGLSIEEHIQQIESEV